MDNFQIETAQNISITQNVAGVGERILAYLIDALIMLSYLILIIFIMTALDFSGGEEWVYSLIIGLPLMLYFLLWEVFWDGRSPGKAALDLRVVKLDGTKPALSNYLVRWLLRIVDITITSGSVAVVTIIINGKGQRLGDLAAGTTVISEKERVGIEGTLLMELPDDYSPVYPQVSLLSDKDVQEIKNLYQDALRTSNYKVIRSLSLKLSDILGVTPEEKPTEFIKNVLNDYTYYTRH
ncbi:RDD family protein [Salinimicrobium flavum]|uniref:RDD family protein n=1 Tax=Salinimicrobium flavum TaxID=1737065 RepID=A0ABW5J057_9FLAO